MKYRCKTIVRRGFEERHCNQSAKYHFDRGKRTGYRVCAECAKSIHQSRLTPLRPEQEPTP